MRLLDSHELALSVHGLKDASAEKGLDIYVGGRNSQVVKKVATKLKEVDFKAVDCRDKGAFRAKGVDVENFVNRCKGKSGGVQLEITKRERKKLNDDSVRMNRFCDAIRDAVDSLVSAKEQ